MGDEEEAKSWRVQDAKMALVIRGISIVLAAPSVLIWLEQTGSWLSTRQWEERPVVSFFDPAPWWYNGEGPIAAILSFVFDMNAGAVLLPFAVFGLALWWFIGAIERNAGA